MPRYLISMTQANAVKLEAALGRRGEIVPSTGGHALVEGNTWHDDYWGNCTCIRHSSVPGANWLGRILENVRDVLTPD